MKAKKRLRPGQFGCKFDLLPEEIRFHPCQDGSVLLVPPVGKEIGQRYGLMAAAATRLAEARAAEEAK